MLQKKATLVSCKGRFETHVVERRKGLATCWPWSDPEFFTPVELLQFEVKLVQLSRVDKARP